MRLLQFDFSEADVPRRSVFWLGRTVRGELDLLRRASFRKFEDDRAAINLPGERGILEDVRKAIAEKKRFKPRYVVVVGIGGSSLGTKALHDAVNGYFHSKEEHQTKLLFVDTVDADYTFDVLRLAESALEEGEEIVVNLICKSGSTVESLALGRVFVNLLKKHRKDYHKFVVVTSDLDSGLWKSARKAGYRTLEIPTKVGGRFSVLSPVGLFPLGMAGFALNELLDGAEHMRRVCLEPQFRKNPAAIAAIIQYYHYSQGRKISDLVVFSKELASLGEWYRQLFAESLGKEFSAGGLRRVYEGITPVVSTGSDLSAILQLGLGGPDDKLTTFLRVQQPREDIFVPHSSVYEHVAAHIQGKSFQKISDSVADAAEMMYRRKERPFVGIRIPDLSAESLGQLIQFFIFEVMILGALMDVNPFDQPNVEEYKVRARQKLGGENA